MLSREETKRLRRSESGQALVFAAVTFFALAIMALMIFGISRATGDRMEAQNAADAGAYAAAETLADCVGQMAWLNESMAEIYYHNMRMNVDCIVTGVHAELAEHRLFYGGGDSGYDWTLFEPGGDPRSQGEINDWVNLRSSSGGAINAVTAYNTAWGDARNRIPDNENTLRRLSRMQRGIATMTPRLIEHQAVYTALKNMGGLDESQEYADRPWAVLWPRLNFNTSNPSRILLNISHSGDDWEFMAVDPPDIYHLTANLINPADPEQWSFREEENSQVSEFDISQYGDPVYRVVFDGTIFQAGGVNPESFHQEILIDPDGTVTTMNNEGDNTTIRYDDTVDPPEYTITDNNTGRETRMRQNPDTGYTEYYENGEWHSLGGETVTEDGVELPVNHDPRIDLGHGVSLWINQPIHIYFSGFTVVLSDPLNINVHSPYGWIHVENDYATVHGLSTRNASPQFRATPWSNGTSDHRLMETGDNMWQYERRNFGGCVQDMPFRKFATHAVMDRDEEYINNTSSRPERRFAILEEGEDDDYLNPNIETYRASRWNDFPQWARPARIPQSSQDDDYGGFYDISRGHPGHREGNNYQTVYCQTRECWYCTEHYDDPNNTNNPNNRFEPSVAGSPPGQIMNYDTTDSRVSGNGGQPILCLRPAGFWYEGFASFEEMQLRYAALLAGWQMTFGGGTPAMPLTTAQALLQSGNRFRFVLQITCPVCAWKMSMHGSMSQWPEGIGTHHPQIETDNEHPAVVRKYLGHAIGRHNISLRLIVPGLGWIRNNVFAPSNRNIDKTADAGIRDFFSTITPNSGSGNWQRPLELRSEFFRKGLTCVAWKPAGASDLFEEIGGRAPSAQLRNMGIYNPVEDPRWGHFGIASARTVFSDYADLDGQVSGHRRVHNFEWENVGEDSGIIDNDHWVRTSGEYGSLGSPALDEDIDPLLRPLNAQREMWVCGHTNLFDPRWEAMLVSNRKGAHINDVYNIDDFSNGIVNDDNATSYMLRRIWTGMWCNEVNDLYLTHWRWGRNNAPGRSWVTMAAPPMQGHGRNIDHEDPRIKEIVRH